MAHAEPDISTFLVWITNTVADKTRIVTTWIQNHKSVPIYGLTHYTVEVV